MFNVSSVTSNQNVLHSQGLLASSMAEKIQTAFQRGVFKPYEKELQKPRESWGDSWFKIIERMSRPGSMEKSDQQYLVTTYLFTVSVDPEISEEDRTKLVLDTITPLEKEELKNFYYMLGHSNPVVSISILRYCPDDMWDKTFRKIRKYENIDISLDKTVSSWIESLIHTPWAINEKQAFLDRLFHLLPAATADEIIYYYLLNNPQSLQQVCSAALSDRIKTLHEEVQNIGKQLLTTIEEQDQPERLPRMHKNKTHYFLEWFLKEALDHPKSDMIVLNFGEEEWKWLNEKFKELDQSSSSPFAIQKSSKWDLSAYAKKWMIDLSNRLSTNTFLQKSLDEHDSCISIFYRYASEYASISNELLQALTPRHLHRYMESFRNGFREALIRMIVNDEPKKLIEWMELIQQRHGRYNETASDTISKVFDWIGSAGKFEEAVRVIFSTDADGNSVNKDPLVITVFAALGQDKRKTILKYILDNQGLNTLLKWIDICAVTAADSGIESHQLKSHIADSLSKNFYTLLNEINPAVAPDLKNQWISTRKGCVFGCDVGTEFIDTLLPVGVDMNDPLVRQEEAFKKLKKHFLTPHISLKHRREFMEQIDKKDLRGSMTVQQLILRLFQDLPKPAWPLIFIHFEYDICHSHYDDYYEEKSRGGSFKKVKKNEGPRMSGRQENIGREMGEMYANQILENPKKNAHMLSNVLMWSKIEAIHDAGAKLSKKPPEKGFQDAGQWIEIAAETLVQMADNPLLTGDKDEDRSDQAYWAMRPLYQAACETNTLYPILQLFINKTPYDKFIPTMNGLACSCFNYNPEDFKGLIADALELSGRDKTDFIAQCLNAHHKRISANSNRRGHINLENDLWEEPILKEDNERAQVTQKFVQLMKVDFLGLFLQHNRFNEPMIKSIKNAAPEFCRQLFVDSIQVLCKVSNPDEVKFVCFQNMCGVYRDVGIDIMPLIHEEQRALIRQWYTPDILLRRLSMNEDGLKLLLALNLEHFYPVIFKKMEGILNEDHMSLWNLSGCWKSLEKEGCGPSLQQQLFDGSHQNILASILKNLEEDFSESFLQFDTPFCFSLIAQIVPDWKERLLLSSQNELKKEIERGMEYGYKMKALPSCLEKIFKGLSRIGNLDEWLAYVKEKCDEEGSKKKFEEGYVAWQQEKQKKKGDDSCAMS